MKRLSLAAMAASLILVACNNSSTQTAEAPAAPPPPPGAQDFSKVEEKATDLGNGIYWIAGAGGNTTLAVGTDGLIVIDTQFAPAYDKLKAKIAEISKLPVKYVIDTHYHGDHTGGNASFAKDGAVIVAQKDAGQHMSAPPPGPNGQPGTPAPAEAIPTQTYTDKTTIMVGGQTAELTHPVPAHTDSDTIVYFPAANVIATGDIVGSESYPNIDVNVGGSIDGMIAAVDQILGMINDQTKVVPGHGHVFDKAGVMEYRAMLVTARDAIAKEKAAGKSEDEMMADMPIAELDKKWAANGGMFAKLFPRLVYRSLK